MRTKNVIKNGYWGLISQLTNTILGFISRTIFIQILGSEFLGLSGLFSNILTMLSLAELGFSTAVGVNLYKPLVNKNYEEVSSIMVFYKKFFRRVFFIVLLLGFGIAPFIRLIIKSTTVHVYMLYFIYFIFLFKTASSYLFSYKFTLVNADQKGYLLIKYDTVLRIFTTVINSIFLVIYRNYMIYLVVDFAQFLFFEIMKTRYISSKYDFLDNDAKISLSMEKKLMSDSRNIFAGKVSSVIVNSTDNVIISFFIGINSVGILSNYTMIIGYVQSFISQITNSTQSGVGNLVASESPDYVSLVMKRLMFIIFLPLSFSVISLLLLLNPFINLWIGKDYLLSDTVVFACVMSFYIQIIKAPLWQTLTAVGLFSQDRNISIIGAVSNLLISLLLVGPYGIMGVIVGTIVSQIIQFVLKTELLYKHYFRNDSRELYRLFLHYMIIVLVQYLVIAGLARIFLPMYDLSSFAILVTICAIVPNLLNYFIFRESDYYHYLVNEVLKPRFLSIIKEKIE